MYCNFMLLSVAVCREWLKNVDIDWSRVNDKSNIDMVCDEDDFEGNSVFVTVHYEDGNDEGKHHTCEKSIVCCVSGDFGFNGVPLQKFVDIVKKTDEKMMLLCTEYGGLGRAVLYEFRPSHRYVLSDIMVECNDDQ